MKKVISLFFAGILSIMIAMPTFASGFENPPVVDGAGYLTAQELEHVSAKLEQVRQKYDFEVAIVTEMEMSGYDAMSTADDIYDYQGYGGGTGDDGILLYICSDTREYWLTTHADGLRVFNDRGLGYIESNIQPHLANDDYYSAMDTFADLADELLNMAANGEPYNEKQLSLTYILIVLACVLFIPLIIASSMTNSQLAKMKTAVENDYAGNYIKNGSKRLDLSRDIFLYSHITKTAKPKETSSSHRSSSGRTHGGSGGSF